MRLAARRPSARQAAPPSSSTVCAPRPARAATRSMRSPGTMLAGDGGTGAAIVSVGDQDTSAGMMTVEMRPGADAASATAAAAQGN